MKIEIEAKLLGSMEYILESLGYDMKDPNFQRTPERWARMMTKELNHQSVFHFTTFPNEPRTDEMVTVTGIRFYSLCAHHVVPFWGEATVGYIPADKVVGLSKLARCVEYHSRRLTTQETITQNVLDEVLAELTPVAAGVCIRSRHLCMEMRGIQKPGTVTVTTALSPRLKSDGVARAEFLRLVPQGEL